MGNIIGKCPHCRYTAGPNNMARHLKQKHADQLANHNKQDQDRHRNWLLPTAAGNRCKFCDQKFRNWRYAEHVLTCEKNPLVSKQKQPGKCPKCGRVVEQNMVSSHMKLFHPVNIPNRIDETPTKLGRSKGKERGVSKQAHNSTVFRELNGRFGSYPLHDSYSDESSPRDNPDLRDRG